MQQLDFTKTKEILRRYKLPYTESYLIKTEGQALKIVKKIGFPVVLKLSSPELIHKSDIGGVFTNINDEKQLTDSFSLLLRNAKKKRIKIEGITLQRQEEGLEVIIGAKRDPQFGPIILFGLGGLYVEVFKDFSLRIAPIDKKLALEMIDEIKSSSILKGARGKKPVNINAIIDILLKVSKLMLSNKNIVQLDLNPVIVNEKSAKIVDAKIIKNGES